MSRLTQFTHFRDTAPVILPSMLQCDFANLRHEIQQLEEAQVRALHLDVMDGNFVPNLTYGMPIVAAIRSLTDLPLDVHLMISQPERYVRQFQEAGADLITIHAEAVADPELVLQEIRDLGVFAGLAINPATSVESIEPCLAHCDLVLVMSVEPGFGGQQFQLSAIEKLRKLRETQGRSFLLEVDGGINSKTIAECGAAGAEMFVVGSAIFGASSYRPVVAELTKLATV